MRKLLACSVLFLSSYSFGSDANRPIPMFDRFPPQANQDLLKRLELRLNTKTPDQWREFILAQENGFTEQGDEEGAKICYKYCTKEPDGTETCHEVCVEK